MRTLKAPSFALFALAASLLAAGASAETPAAAADTTQVLFTPKAMYPAQGGPAAKLARIGDRTVALAGGIGSLTLGGGLGLGVASYSLAQEAPVEFKGAVHDTGLTYGGVVIENNFFSRRLLYFRVSTLVGLGQADSVARLSGASRERVSFFVAEPEFTTMLNVTRELRVGLGLGYRLFGGATVSEVTGTELQGFSGTFTIYYGGV